MKKALILFAIVAIVVIIAVVQSRGMNEAQSVSAEVFAEHPIRASILASGKLGHEEEVQLSTEVIGKVAALYVDEGDAVSGGQLLAQIDDEAPRAMVEQQQASTRMQEIAIESSRLRLANLQLQWDRKKMMHERGLLEGGDDAFEAATNELELARLDIQTREASLAQAKALLEEAEKNLDRTRVLSPLTGIVTSLDIKVGEMAISSTTNVPGSSLMTIANPASIHTEVNVDEADIANVELGQDAEVVAIAYPDQPMQGTVSSIAISAKQPTGTTSLSFLVDIAFTDTAGVVLRPGMSARAEIFTSDSEPKPAVPLQAVLVEEDRSAGEKTYSVFVLDKSVARKRAVEVGISDDSHQEIRSGLEPGDRVITGPDRILRNLEDGDAVQEAGASPA
ncbi:MAG: efflux RND transporter periplasmic adaptor subunit, partial [Pseudohongiellaceae bacterium]